jgi:hypothetical protein
MYLTAIAAVTYGLHSLFNKSTDNYWTKQGYQSSTINRNLYMKMSGDTAVEMRYADRLSGNKTFFDFKNNTAVVSTENKVSTGSQKRQRWETVNQDFTVSLEDYQSGQNGMNTENQFAAAQGYYKDMQSIRH